MVVELPLVKTFFHVSLYFFIVTARLSLDLLLVTPLLGGEGNDEGIMDESMVDAVEWLVATVGFVGRIVCRIASSKKMSASVICLSLLAFPASSRRES